GGGVAVPAVRIADGRGDLEVRRRDALLGVAGRHRELELPEGGDRAARAVGDLRAGVKVHIRGTEVPDRERVAREVDRGRAVIHRDLGAVRVVDAGREHVWLAL